MGSTTYEQFLAAKVEIAKPRGFQVRDEDLHPALKPHQRAVVKWAVRLGRAAIFAAFGLGKTVIALEIVRLILLYAGGGRGLIVIPLGVRQEFMRDARELLGLELTFIRTTEEATGDGIYLTNYESIREGKIDPAAFVVVSLDEASALRGMGGTKTFRQFMALLAGDDRTHSGVATGGVPYRFVATATPSPNDFIELLAYSAYLGIQDVSQAKTRFFSRDSEKSDHLTLHPHKQREFWLWVASWAVVITKPSDLGPEFSDEGYILPELKLHFHLVPAAAVTLKDQERDGQLRILRDSAVGLQEAAREKRESLAARVAKLREILNADPASHYLLWHDLEAERHAIQKAVPSAVSVWGSQPLEEREARVIAFSNGECQYLSSKPVLLGSGCNFQRHCHKAIFLGVGYKANDWIQAIHRILRFLQEHQVDIHLIYTEAEQAVLQALLTKWEQHKILTEQLSAIVRQYGLGHAALETELQRGMGVERREVSGQGWRLVNNDTVQETAVMEANSVGLILTSIPFSTQYEYSPNYADFGHTDDNAHFWEQMGFLIPELLRVLQPGRICAIHVKDRIVPGGLTGLGFQTVYPFHCDAIAHFTRHGFAYLGMRTIVTDVVRENNQTYRLGWTEQCKDGSRMGCGMPEYLLLFRKPPTDHTDGYADLPVVKDKQNYTRARWQMDAHGFWRSNGDRPLRPEDLEGLTHAEIFRLFRKHSYTTVYDHEAHVALAESLEHRGMLPVKFMLLQPQSWTEEVWSDVTRMRTLNMLQQQKGQEQHLCPLQFDICERVIRQHSMPGELIYDPFAGLGTVPYCALQLGRQGLGTELNPTYFDDAVFYLRQAEHAARIPTLFDLAALDDEAEADAPDGMHEELPAKAVPVDGPWLAPYTALAVDPKPGDAFTCRGEDGQEERGMVVEREGPYLRLQVTHVEGEAEAYPLLFTDRWPASLRIERKAVAA